MSNAVMHFIQSGGYFAVFVAMVLESACIPLPSDVVMPFGGYMAWAGHLSLWGVIIAGTVGNIIGSLIAYYVGKLGGQALIIRYGRYIRLSVRHLDAAERWFDRRGEWAVFLGRLLPGIRTFISLPAGIARMSVLRFTLFTTIGSLPWVAALAYAGYRLGTNWEGIKPYTHVLLFVSAVIVAAGVAIVVYNRRVRANLKQGT